MVDAVEPLAPAAALAALLAGLLQLTHPLAQGVGTLDKNGQLLDQRSQDKLGARLAGHLGAVIEQE